MRNLMVCLVLFTAALTGCNAPGPVHMTEVECEVDVDCSIGEYCDSFTSLCGWDCRSDSDVECAPGMFCQLDTGRCLREEVPPPPPDTSPVLEITAGPTEDLTVLAGTADAELLRFTIVNRSTQPVWITELPVQIAPLSGFALTGVLGEVKVRNERTRVTVMGPMNLEGAMITTSFTFVDAFSIMPGESVDLAVRVDLQAGASSEFDFVIGTTDGTLGLHPIFADTSIGVRAELITNNVTLVRHVNVLNSEAMSGDAVLLYSFEGRTSNISGREGFHSLGVLTLTAFGGPVDFHGVTMSGAPFEGFASIGLARAGRAEGPLASTIGSFIDLRLSTPRRIASGESITYDVWAMLAPTARGFEFSMNFAGVDAYPVGEAELTVARLGDGLPTRLRVWTAFPVITPQTLSSTTIANGLQQDLYKVQISSSEAATVDIGSLTFRVGGLGIDRTLTNFRVRRGSTEIAPGDYRVINPFDGTDLEDGTLVGFPGAYQVTVIFDVPLEITGSGQTITLTATPNSFVEGDLIWVAFGDRRGTYDTLSGVLNANGTLSSPEIFGDDSWIDCVVWSDTGVRWTGTWGLETLDEVEMLTR